MPKRDDSRWALPLQILLAGGAVLLYFGVRGVTESKEETALANARDDLHFESLLRLDLEQSAQNWLLDHDWAVTLANWVYSLVTGRS
ncbi:MAG: hypothetical protein OER95_08680 [Acidimicrobiia bacterium]|nr:hypothetical protein [Acidimicrobiia bacterium]